MALIFKKDESWVVGGRKYEGKTLQEIAVQDPLYLQWLHKEASMYLSDDAYYALIDMMKSYGIDLDKSKNREGQSG